MADLSRPSVQILGTVMVVVSTVAIAVVPTFARLAYDAGSNTLTVITARSVVTVLLTWILARSLRQSLSIDRQAHVLCVGTGLCYAVMLYGFLGAVAYIPINSVIVIYFLHPLVVGLVAVRLGDEPITPGMVGALVAACVGLALAIGFAVDRLNLVGLALAIVAMLTCVGVIIGNGKAVKLSNGLAVVFHMMLWASLFLICLFLALGVWSVPGTPLGWFGFVGVAIASTIGTLTFFCAVPLVGVVRATMISNVEPLLGILFAVAFVGEFITMVQWAGIAIVLGSILWMETLRSSASG